MLRRSTRHASAACMLLLVASCAREHQATVASLAGYVLGATWQKVGQSLPCHSTPNAGYDLVWSRYRYLGLTGDLKWCDPADTVTLLFSRDTLVDITVQVPKGRDSPEVIWRTRLGPTLTSSLGAPDSVTTRLEPRQWIDARAPLTTPKTSPCRTCIPMPLHRALTAVWRPRAGRAWTAEASLSGSDSLSLPFARPGPVGLPPSSEGIVSLSACGIGYLPRCPR